jgi:hypothetical protein
MPRNTPRQRRGALLIRGPSPWVPAQRSGIPDDASHRREHAATRPGHGTHLRLLATQSARALQDHRPSEIRGRRESRVLQAHPQLRVQKVESTQISHHRFAGNSRPSLRNGFNGLLCGLPGDRAFLPPSWCDARHHRQLIPASRDQDATTSPSALRCVRLCIESVHRIPRPTLVTIGQTPLLIGHRTGEEEPLICPTAQATRLRHFNATGKSVCESERLSRTVKQTGSACTRSGHSKSWRCPCLGA